MGVACRICGQEELIPKFRKSGAEILRCGRCGVECWIPSDPQEIAQLYTRDYFESGSPSGYESYGSLEGSLTRTFERRFRQLGRAEGRSLLDVGAAYGFALTVAQELGFRAVGLEYSEAAREAGLRVPGRVVRGSAESLPFAGGTFDVVTLWDVLEHLPEPAEAIREIARCTRPGGRLLLTTGDVGSIVARVSGARWHLYNLPEHLFFFSRAGLELLLASNGYRVERMKSEGGYYTVGYLIERLRKTLIPRLGLPGPLGWLRERAVRVDLGDIVLVEAVRT